MSKRKLKSKPNPNSNSLEYPILVSNFLAPDLLARVTILDDDKCSDCGYIYPYILTSPDSPDDKKYLPGSHPYCKGQWRDHLTRRVEHMIHYGSYSMNTYTQGISTIVFVNSKGEISVPPNPDVPCPPGYSKRTISSLAEAQQFTQELRRQAKENYEQFHRLEEQRWNSYYKSLGDELRSGAQIPVARYNSDGSIAGYDIRKVRPLSEMSSEMQEIALEAERIYSQYSGYNPNEDFMVGIQALDFDESTLRRMAYD